MTVTNAEQPGEIDQATAAAITTAEQVEGEIRAFVRRDVSVLRRPRAENHNEVSVDGINSLIERVAGASVAEIEHAIVELTRVRDMLRNEGERVQREITGYASLSQAAMTSMKIIADSLAHWRTQTSQTGHSRG